MIETAGYVILFLTLGAVAGWSCRTLWDHLRPRDTIWCEDPLDIDEEPH